MKNILIGCAIGIASVALVAVSYFSYIFYFMHEEGKKLDAESKVFVDMVVPEVFEKLDTATLHKYAMAELFQNVSEEKWSGWFSDVSKLGGMKKYMGSTGEAFAHYSRTKGDTITARYYATTQFDKGEVKTMVELIKKEYGWKIFTFKFTLNPEPDATAPNPEMQHK